MAAKSHRALKITGIVIGAIVAVALIAVVALNIYMRVAFAPFFDRAEFPSTSRASTPVSSPMYLDHVEADDSWLFSGYMADHSPSPIYRRAADGTIAKFYVALPDGSPLRRPRLGHHHQRAVRLSGLRGGLSRHPHGEPAVRRGRRLRAGHREGGRRLLPRLHEHRAGSASARELLLPERLRDAGEPPHHHAGRHREPRRHVRFRRRSCTRPGRFAHGARQRVLHSRDSCPGHLYRPTTGASCCRSPTASRPRTCSLTT